MISGSTQTQLRSAVMAHMEEALFRYTESWLLFMQAAELPLKGGNSTHHEQAFEPLLQLQSCLFRMTRLCLRDVHPAKLHEEFQHYDRLFLRINKQLQGWMDQADRDSPLLHHFAAPLKQLLQGNEEKRLYMRSLLRNSDEPTDDRRG